MTRLQLLLASIIGIAATALPASRAFADDDDVKKVVASPAHCAVSIHPNGSITYASDADPNTFCLADDPNATSTWGADAKAIKVSRRTLTGDLERLGYDAGGTKKPLEPGHVYSIPFDAADSANIVIQGRPALADPAALDKLQQAVEDDKDLAKSVDKILQSEGSDDDGRDIIESDVVDLSKSDWWPMFGGPLSKADGKLAPLLILDATGNTSRSDNRYSDGTFVRGWAYNLWLSPRFDGSAGADAVA